MSENLAIYLRELVEIIGNELFQLQGPKLTKRRG
jgi:hypothetical protein